MSPFSLLDGARALALDLDEAQLGKLVAHLDLLDEWNARFNLTAIRDRPAQLTKHLLDSLTVQPYLRGQRIADVGSGAGFPGIPLAIVEPGRHFSLIESTGKKCRFLEHVREALGLANVEVVQARAEAYHPEVRFDTVIARAVGPVADLVKAAGPLVVGGGRLLAMKGRYPEDELATRLNGWKVAAVHPLTVPGLAEERHLVELCRSHDRVG
jgi:16S rRNA (guanine527-N7)-methyltransferase